VISENDLMNWMIITSETTSHCTGIVQICGREMHIVRVL